MAIGMIIDVPGGSQEQYDRVMAAVGPHLPSALLFHAAGPREGGWIVTDVWESQEAANTFLEQHLAQALRQAGMSTDSAPTVFPIHNLIRR